ncbi:sigma 54-interacting transcriptional regulator [Enterococcus saccharolyticus]|uniref:sigma 54-interacting transcriptional regulator n=1 Tax=Enterococcus saccharolyticus TaxID=41997 RepID=UPI0039DFACB5
MKRIEKVYQALLNIWQECEKQELLMKSGSSAKELANQLNLTRSNTSLELNRLVREKRVLKIKSYPVGYLPIKVLEEKLQIQWDNQIEEITDLSTFIQHPVQKVKRNPFESMIGSTNSLKKAVFQAKAAVYYPPNGLHMLLLGPTGSGKTYFANKIYQYSIFEKLIDEDAPFESFNCADYYHNPQLLLSQLFGYTKGAFTGAEEDHAGLVEKANGGILLLDEIHRLTPEGQEMLFYFIDHNRFNRLGETGFKRQAKVLIICATTEDPNSSLLETFLRRIPMTIQIPALNQRSLRERIELTKFLFEKEAKRVQRTFVIDIDVINALINTAAYGNVGQLQSHIQLICAQSFLHNLHEKNKISIGIQELPEEMLSQWSSSSKNIQRSREIEELVGVTTVIHPSEKGLDEEYEGLNIYEIIEEKVKILENEGIPEAQIHQYILTDLHLHVKNFINNKAVNYNLLKFVDPTISNLTIELKKIAEKNLGVRFDRKFLYYIGMHLDAYFRREKKDKLLSQLDIHTITSDHSREYEVAQLFKLEIETCLGVFLPEIEVIYLTMLLVSIETVEEKRQVSVLVVTHGNSTATSMVQVAVELLGAAPIVALDMPLNLSPDEMFQRILHQIEELETENGVLMLVDMGSLAMMENKLMEKSGVTIKTIPNVTTLIVLDVVRKINYMDLSLAGIYSSVMKDFLATVQLQDNGRAKAILSICTTGRGTAKKMEQMIAGVLQNSTEESVEIITVSSLKIHQAMPKLIEQYQILATVGTKDPKIDVPHISLEDLIEGSGDKVLRQAVGLPYEKKQRKPKNTVVKDLCQDALNTYLVYLNPYHLTDLLLDWTKELQMKVETTFSNILILKLVVHTAFAFERVIKQDSLTYTDPWREELKEPLEVVSNTIKSLEEKLVLSLSEDEKIFIAEVLLNE